MLSYYEMYDESAFGRLSKKSKIILKGLLKFRFKVPHLRLIFGIFLPCHNNIQKSGIVTITQEYFNYYNWKWLFRDNKPNGMIWKPLEKIWTRWFNSRGNYKLWGMLFKYPWWQLLEFIIHCGEFALKSYRKLLFFYFCNFQCHGYLLKCMEFPESWKNNFEVIEKFYR